MKWINDTSESKTLTASVNRNYIPRSTSAMLNNLKWVFAAILTICGTSVFTSCSSNDDDNTDAAQEYTGVPLVILDTDIGSSTDDLFALEMLHYYQQQGRCKLLGVVVDREGEDCPSRRATVRPCSPAVSTTTQRCPTAGNSTDGCSPRSPTTR